MTEKTAWADLPNAKHIDRVIASVRQNPEKWKAARGAAMAAAAWDAAYGAVRDAAWDAAGPAAWAAEIGRAHV